MGDKSRIEWLNGGATWNVSYGCTKVSAGCKNCYAARTLPRLGKSLDRFELAPDRLDLPLRWKRPRMVFVNSLSDLFHESVPDEYLDCVFARMLADVVFERGPRHTFQVLTKRTERMRAYLSMPAVDLLRRWAKAGDGQITVGDGDVWFSEYVGSVMSALWDDHGHATTPVVAWSQPGRIWPLPNVWLGISVEDRRARSRIAELEATPAALRFVSFEPLLEDLGDLQLAGTGIGWAIVGGESGPKARPCDVEWIRSIVRQCRAADVPVFVKQDSGPRPGRQGRIPDDLWKRKEFPRGP